MTGPRPLRALLEGWSGRGARARTQPLFEHAFGALCAAWERAVGADIARRSRPHKFHNGVLTVLTASSAWSDELTSHAPRIVQALLRDCPGAQLKRLRFMVASGRTKALLDGVRRRAPAPATQQAAIPQLRHRSPQNKPARPFDVAELEASIQQLAVLQASLDAARDLAGWKICLSCQRRFAAETPQVTQCAPCAEKSRRATQAVVERALMQAPWLRADALRQAFPQIATTTYERARRRLLTRWQFELDAAGRRLRRGAVSAEDRMVAWSYLMLLTGLSQGDIGRAVVTEVLGRDWCSALFGDEKTQKEEARRPQREKHKQ